MSAARSLVSLNGVRKEYSTRTVLREVTLGVTAGERIGVVGRNGEGKSTLLRLIAGVEVPDGGVPTRVGELGIAMLAQGDELREDATIREELVGERAEHEWAGDRSFREVLGGVELSRFHDVAVRGHATLSDGQEITASASGVTARGRWCGTSPAENGGGCSACVY
jgi:ATP-binding cassette subfamily F protein uup